MRDLRRFRGLPLAGVAVAGVVTGHWLSYLIAVPDAPLRESLLAGSGHSYWFLAVRLALLAAVAGLGTTGLRHVWALPRDQGTPAHRTFAWLALLLGLIQVTGFVILEIVERLAAGSALAGLFGHSLLTLGVAIQVLMACVGALLVMVVARTARCAAVVLATRSVRWRPDVSIVRPSLLPAPTLRPMVGAAGPRGPPTR
jgi:hypothetical protein